MTSYSSEASRIHATVKVSPIQDFNVDNRTEFHTEITTEYFQTTETNMNLVGWNNSYDNRSDIYGDINSTVANTSTISKPYDYLPFIRRVCEVYISMPVALAGFVGSLISFTVLCNHRPRLTPTVILQHLSLADAVVLALSLVLRSFRYVDPPIPGYNDQFFPYAFCVLYPLVYISRLYGTWLVVLLTVDRYIAVCHPLHVRRLCTVTTTRLSVCVILVISVLFSIPRFFEQVLDPTNEFGFKMTSLVDNSGPWSKAYTFTYRILFFFIVMYLVPFITVCVLNTMLLRQLKIALAARSQLHSNPTTSSLTLSTSGTGERSTGIDQTSAAVSHSHVRLTWITVAIVLMTVTCDIFAMIAHSLWSLHYAIPSLKHLEYYRRYMSNWNNVLVTLNSSSRFIVYCALSRQFRHVVGQMMRCQSLRAAGQYSSRIAVVTGTTLNRLSGMKSTGGSVASLHCSQLNINQQSRSHSRSQSPLSQ